jgi:hypothetical protein
MKKVVLTFGLLSGAVSSVMMLSTIPFIDQITNHAEVLGYTTIVASFLLVFFGVRSYRDNVGGGSVTFARAFGVGLLMTVISCACYVTTWEFLYFKVMPDFADKYAAHAIEHARASGQSEAQIDALAKQMADFKVMYQKPLVNIAMTFMEPFPVGLGVTRISAAVLRRRGAGRPNPTAV